MSTQSDGISETLFPPYAQLHPVKCISGLVVHDSLLFLSTRIAHADSAAFTIDGIVSPDNV